MLLFPPAKINLGLRILGKREDGFHDIETCMIPVPINDILEIHKSNHFEFIQTGLKIDSPADENLCVLAFQLMKDRYETGNVSIHLRKEIPMGAGLGGGSADATFVLRGMNKLFDLNLTDDILENLAAELGSDCPFFVKDVIQIAQGRGEKLSALDLDLSGCFVHIVNPGIHVSTAEAYSGAKINSKGDSLSGLIKSPVKNWKSTIHNGFESSVFKQHPELEVLKKQMFENGAFYASMTGSGSTIYGLYKTEPAKLEIAHYQKIVEL